MPYSPANPFDYLMSGGFRSYNGVPSKQDAFIYGFNPQYDNGKGQTGQMQLLTLTNQGALRVDVGTGISINASFSGLSISVGNVAVTGVTNVTGQVAITNPVLAVTGNVQASLTGNVPVQVVNAIAVTGTSWQKVSSSGYVSLFAPLSATSCLVNKIQGISKTSTQPSWIQVYDGATGAGCFPVASVPTLQNNAWFIDLAEAGVAFSSGVTIVNSTDGVLLQQAGLSADLFATVVWKAS